MFSLNSRGKWALHKFLPWTKYYFRHFKQFLQLLLWNKLRFSAPFKCKVFALFIVQYCSTMIIAAAWIRLCRRAVCVCSINWMMEYQGIGLKLRYKEALNSNYKWCVSKKGDSWYHGIMPINSMFVQGTGHYYE